MDVQIEPRRLSGAVTPPPSKSMAHRAILALSLCADTDASISNLAPSQDIDATIRCVSALRDASSGLPFLDCGESGSTLRFLIPLALALRGGGQFTGRGRLMERPMTPYFDLFTEKGISWDQSDGVLTVRGTLTPGTYPIPGNVSSQFVTGLLYALPLLSGDSTIQITSALESRPYVEMTLEMLRSFGIHVDCPSDHTFFIPGRQHFQGRSVSIEADWSQAAFWYAANFLDSQVHIQGLHPASAQGDKVISSLYWQLARPGDTTVDLAACPDLLPPLSVMAAVRSGTTRFTGAARLRIKESDRLRSAAALLTALGGSAEEGSDYLIVHGGPLAGGQVSGANDHRIVMAAAIAATACNSPVTILGAEAVNKSYPTFWEDYQQLGGIVHVL